MAKRSAARKLVGANFLHIDGGHLFPMESPQQAAQLTEQMIGRLLPALA